MADLSFIKRRIEVSIQLAPNSGTNQPSTFSESGTDSVTLSEFRTSVRIQNSGAPSGAKASVSVFGMPKSLMDQLTTLGMVFSIIPRNTLLVRAGDEEAGLSPVFGGTIVQAYADYNASPIVPFIFECHSGLAEATTPAEASSFPGATDVATIMAGFARLANLGFENNGVNVKLASPYFSGSVKTQWETCAQHAGINAEIINGNVLAIWPKGGSRNTPTVPLLSPQTGMVGYPSYTQQGIVVKSIFNPAISMGTMIRVESSVKLTTQDWAVNKLDLSLDSQVPRGDWLSTIYAYNPNYPRPLVGRASQ